MIEYVQAYVDGCEIVFAMDKVVKKSLYSIPLLKPEDAIPRCDIIISTVVGMQHEIRAVLQDKTTAEIVPFEDIIG